MDNSWRIKFDSTLQSSMPSMASSASQEPQNQMVINSGQYFHQHVAQDLSSTLHGRMRDPMPPNSSNLCSIKSNHSEQANSFLALLSGSPSLLQCDFQELSSRKVFNASRSVNINDFGSEIPPIAGALLSETLSNQNTQNGANSVVPSRLVLSSTGSGVSFLHGSLHASNSNLQTSDLAKVVNHLRLPGTEKVKDVPTLNGDWYGTSSTTKAGNLYSKNIQMSTKRAEELNSSTSDQSSTNLSGCPRVFCLGTGGYLLLSNTGLLGIVCSCHFFHTSVSKFCEHSGLCDVNPGDAVRMESGETIAQWRKLYFEKFGIRVPEDHSGWDWPEGLLPTAGLVKSSATEPKISKTSHLVNQVGSSQGLSRCMDNTMSPSNPQTGQNSATGLLHNKQEQKIEGSSNFLLKHLIGASQSNLHDVADGQRMECAVTRSSTMSTFVGRDSDNGCQSMSVWIDSILKTGNSSLAHSSLQNLRSLGQNYDVSAAKIADDGVISDRDATSSNVELKLGQPYQQSQPIGNTALPFIARKRFGTVVDPPKSCYPEPMIHHANFCGEEESRQYCHHDADSSNRTARRQQSHLILGNHAFGVSSVMDATKLDKCRGDATKSLVVPLLPQLPLEGSARSRGANNMAGEFSMPKTFHCESNTTKCDPLNTPLTIGNTLGRQLNMPELGFCRLTDKGNAGSECVSFCTATDPALRIHQQVENPRNVTGVVPGFSAVHGMDSCQSSNIHSDRFDERSCLNLPGNSSFIGSSGYTDQAYLRMMSSHLGSGQISQSSAASMGYQLATSTFIPGPTSTISQESPCLLDDSMRLLALRQILELSKQHATSSVGMSHELGRFDRTSNPNVQHCLMESSKSREDRHGAIVPSKLDVFEGAAASVPSPAAEKSIPKTGLNSRCDFSTLTQGLSLCSREVDIPCQFSNEPFPNQSTLRLIRGESITQSSEHAKCCQRVPCTYFQGNCNCSAHAKCLEGYSECRVGRSHVTSKEQFGVCREAPMSVTSEFVRDHVIPKERTSLLYQGGKVKGQLPVRIACHASQWRDVPSKQKEACKMTLINPSAEVLDASGCAEDQHGDAGMRCIGSAVNRAASFKGQDMSNISSGCSAPDVTQASIEVNNMDSSTIDAEDNGYMNDLVVDEGSGIDKCCSSNDAHESERSAAFIGVSCRSKIRTKGSPRILNGQPSFSLLDELKLIDSLTWKKGKNQIYTSITGSGRTNHLKKIRRGSKAGKRKRTVKFRTLDAAFPPKVSFRHCSSNNGSPQLPSRSSKDWQTLIPSGLEPHGDTDLIQPGELFSAKIVSRKRDLHGVYNDQDGEEDYQPELKGDARFGKIPEVSGRKKLKRAGAFDSFESLGTSKSILRTVEKSYNSNAVHCIKAFSSLEVTFCDKKDRPIVCGEYGEICSRKFATDELRPAKIVPLSRVLKNTEQCTLQKNCKPKSTLRKSKKKRRPKSTVYFDLKKAEENGGNQFSVSHEVSGCHVEEGKKTCVSGIKQFDNNSFILEKGKDDRSEKYCCIPDGIAYNRSNIRCKEIRKRSLYELTGKGKESGSDSHPLMEISKCMPKMKVRKRLKETGDVESHGHRSSNMNAEKSIMQTRCSSIVDSDVFCCVCGSSNKDEFNCLLECSRCSIRVHQACYGILKVPRGHWYCRPCRTSSKDTVCVLCGYGGGAMTQALRSRAFVKGLLKAWNIEAECGPKSTNYSAETVLDDQSLVVSNSFCNLQFKDLELSRTASWKLDVQNQLDIIRNSPCPDSKLNLYNSVTAGVLDSTVKQWVHMVCGLWTPGTRCPNVDTMSAFDVSGVSRKRENVVCSICNRPGGSCIQCRVVDCSVRFHPWCAHQKGLLQSEVEGIDNENVGFYGRCMLHASHCTCESGSEPTDAELSPSRERESTCARTEGFKGRKQDGFWHNIYGQSKRKTGCFVPQEQLNAWIHINGQKSCMQGLPKLPTSDMEYDCRKEYARYKQAKGWKHLVVYKSGIHALGLYTSRFISRGEMVVEYVGEIVGLRVADKRENEYESGRKVQYKSACYFFRIDKEHIIDATRKGGIARFVNHSCLPNCVAKVISVRNEKKVVFFAERDIYPGEEITYDYHFNHEDEGKKIPCFCNSKNCRRYLN
ncbi:PREDICTED: uncharacterized protein LOC18587744 [Theobroma cacao]|uniref:Uncharacterized protein LOC18587744 n=1 Tax=Theobroma cacao TaxID=3641 RepID=A0AB32UND7_THECC|nr:PREDICTED: uncharacterized protein LOC18587744 [Theobroma cacao]